MAPSNTNEATNMSVNKSNNYFGIPKFWPSPSKSRSESSGKTRSKSRLSVSKTQNTRSGSNTKTAPNSNNSGSNKSKKSSSESNRSSSENNKSTKSNTEITDQKKRKERNNLLRKFGKKMREGVVDENLMKKIMNLLPQENSENTETPSKSKSKTSPRSTTKSKTSPRSTTKSKTSPTRSGTSIEQGRNRRRTPSKTPSPDRMNVNQTTPSTLKSALSMSHDRSVRGSASASPFSSPGRPRTKRRVKFANSNSESQKQNKNANRNSTGARNNNGV